jgi:type II secretory pathway predicted ATPase ExeA
MVPNHFKLKRQAFGVAPDPKFLFMSNTHQEALASLIYGVREERGFTALIAPPGMGKTTLLFRFLESLQGHARTVLLFQTQCGTVDFLRYLIRDLGLTPASDVPSMHEQLNEVLLDEAKSGRRFVLVIDEAQGLASSVLESVRLLSDFEIPGRKLMQIILAGQPSLAKTLMRKDLEQLRQRFSIVASLQPFDEQQVGAYIAHRLRAAGHEGGPLFTAGAVHLIAQSSEGIPRKINNLCFNAMSLAYGRDKKLIDRGIVDEARADLSMDSLSPEEPQRTSSTEKKGPSVAVPRFLSDPPRRKWNTAAVAATAAALATLTVAAFAGGWKTNRARTMIPDVSLFAHVEGGRSPVAQSQALVMAEPTSVLVEPGKTLSQISKARLGRYAPETLAALKILNPKLNDPDYIEAGTQIRLPRYTSRAQRSTSEASIPFVTEEQR